MKTDPLTWYFVVKWHGVTDVVAIKASTYKEALKKLGTELAKTFTVDLDFMEGELNPVKPLAIPCRHTLKATVKNGEPGMVERLMWRVLHFIGQV